MIKDNQKYFNRLHVVLDGLMIAASYILAWWLKFESSFSDQSVEVGVLPISIYMSALYLIVPGYLILYYSFRLYTPKRVQRTEDEILNIIKANVFGFIVLLATLFMLNSYVAYMHDFSRAMLAIFAVLNTFNGIIMRAVIRRMLHFFRKKGYNQKHILLVG